VAEIISEGVAKVLCTFGVGAAGGLAVALIANRLRASTEAALNRRRFRSQIELLRGRIESRSEDELAIIHEFREIPKLESEAVQVRHFIQRRLRRRFDSTWRHSAGYIELRMVERLIPMKGVKCGGRVWLKG